MIFAFEGLALAAQGRLRLQVLETDAAPGSWGVSGRYAIFVHTWSKLHALAENPKNNMDRIPFVRTQEPRTEMHGLETLDVHHEPQIVDPQA